MMMNFYRRSFLPLLFAVLIAACDRGGEGIEDDDAERAAESSSVREGVILSDTSLGSASAPRVSEALPGPADLPRTSLPPAPSAGGVTPGQLPPTSPPSSAQAPSSAGGEGWMRGTARRGGGNLGVAILTQVRSARNDGYDRIVFEFEGTVVPGYTIAYIDEPVRQCGSGNVVPMPGDAWLSILIEPAQAHDDQGRATVQQRALSPGLPNIIAINSICDFEAQVEWVAGVRSPEEFRVSELRDPARLVVDIRH
jgi:hypothetical protein